MAKPLLICVVGPTAIGKTSLSIALAKAFKTQIISADSRQFFKEMSIGTAVPTPEELQAVSHHFIRHISIEEPYNVGSFEKDALEQITSLHQKHDKLIMVGGSGLYVDAVVKGLDVFPKIAMGIRASIDTMLIEEGIEALQNELQKVDPSYYQQVDIHNPHRLTRALEVYKQTGKPFSSFLEKAKSDRRFKTLWIGLKAPREIVYNRINTRVDQMMAAGLLKEAKSLYAQRHLNALQTVGYKELFAHFDGAISLGEAVDQIKMNSRRFAKRQETWFRKNKDIHWFDYDSNPEKIIAFIEQN